MAGVVNGVSSQGQVSRLGVYKPPITPRIIAATEGDTGTGKTKFGLTMPRPIGYFSLDRGFEDAQSGSPDDFDWTNVDVGEYSLDAITSRDDTEIAKQAAVIWDDFTRDWARALTHGRIVGKGYQVYRSIIADTGSELYQLLRLARYGRVAKIPPFAYPDLYSEFRAKVIKPAFRSNCNVLFLHKLKDETRSKITRDKKTGNDIEISEKTGRRVLDGMPDFRGGENSYAVPTLIRHERDLTLPVPDRYMLRVVKCAPQPMLDGEVLPGGMDFPTFASMVYPGVDPSNWV